MAYFNDLTGEKLTVNGLTKKIGDSDGFIVPTLFSPWVNRTDSYGPVRFTKVNGIVFMMGLAAGGNVGTNIFQLPVGYRPDSRLIISNIANDVVYRIDIYENGTVRANTGGVNGGWWSVQCSFPADDFYKRGY